MVWNAHRIASSGSLSPGPFLNVINSRESLTPCPLQEGCRLFPGQGMCKVGWGVHILLRIEARRKAKGEKCSFFSHGSLLFPCLICIIDAIYLIKERLSSESAFQNVKQIM